MLGFSSMRLLTPYLFLALLAGTSCGIEKGPLKFKLKGDEKTSFQSEEDLLRQRELWLLKLKSEYAEEVAALESMAKDTYASIEPIVKKKCSDCHDSRVKLPFYGRILPRVNPVNKHQVEGLKALDMKLGFPLLAKGEPDQLSLLKAIKTAILDRTMPLKSYRLVYPFRRVNREDANAFLEWVNPLISEYERLNEKYKELFEEDTVQGKAKRIIQLKCARCHGNGNRRGGLGGFEDLVELKKNEKLFNKRDPEASLFYKVCKTGEMPTDPRERLSSEELESLLEWIREN